MGPDDSAAVCRGKRVVTRAIRVFVRGQKNLIDIDFGRCVGREEDAAALALPRIEPLSLIDIRGHVDHDEAASSVLVHDGNDRGLFVASAAVFLLIAANSRRDGEHGWG